MKKSGTVYLVGAGPGRPELLTLRGAECLSRADAVVLDALVDRRQLRHCRADAQVIEAGKRGRGRVLMRQPAINRLLVRLARSGKDVVRLKGGDPYFFGRGGEEAAFLEAHKIPFEVVPGVSSVAAVPGYAGIPLTYRGYTSTVTVVTGHEGRENPYLRESAGDVNRRRPPGVDWTRFSPDGTLVILMGVGQLPDIVRKLSAAGWPADTPAAAVQWGTFPFQRKVRGRLADLPALAVRARLTPPAVVVVGRVVDLSPRLNWFERLPLFGRRIIVTRAQAQASSFSRLLESRGAWVTEAPVIRVRPLPLGKEGKRFLRGLEDYDGVLFTSANAADVFLAHWKRLGPRRSPPPAYAVGPKTADVLAAGGLPVRGTAREFVAESLAETLGPVRGKKFLFPRARDGREALPDVLRSRGAAVDVWPLYRTVPERMAPDVKRAVLSGEADCVTFTSASTVKNFVGQFPAARVKQIFRRAAAACIGPVTAKALRKAGIKPRILARRSTLEDLSGAITAYFSKRRK